MANIGEHLKKGLLDWLLGALSSAGIELPETFDLKGILTLALSILGLTWANIRGRLVSKVGEPVMAKMEQAVDVFKIIATEGLAGLWKWILDRIGDFQEMVMGEIREFISEKVIKAGIEWLIGILNPAAAFIKACEAIYNVVMFFVEKGKEVIEFVNSVLDSVESILNGGVGAVADLIEGTLAKTIPLIINFLADLLGLGGISEKIKEIIGKIQAPVNKAIDAVIGGALKIGKKMFASLLGKGKKSGSKQSPEERKASNDVRAQVAADLNTKLARPIDGPEALSSILSSVFAAHKEHGLHSLAVQPTGPGEFDVLVSASAAQKEGSGKIEDAAKLRKEDLQVRVSPKTGKLTGVPGVALLARFNGIPLPRQESESHDHHAEDALIAYIRSLRHAPSGQRDQLTVMITKSTCPRCGKRLAAFAQERNIDLTLSLMGFYFGKGKTNREWERSFWAMVELRRAGATLVVPTFEEVTRNLAEEIDDKSKKALIERLAYIKPLVDVVNSKTQQIGKVRAS